MAVTKQKPSPAQKNPSSTSSPSQTKVEKKQAPKRVSDELRRMADEALIEHEKGLTEDFPT